MKNPIRIFFLALVIILLANLPLHAQTAIADWSWVPKPQYGIVKPELLAFHINGIKRVDWFLDDIYIASTDTLDVHSISLSTDKMSLGDRSLRAEVIPNQGTMKVLTTTFWNGPNVINRLPAGVTKFADIRNIKPDATGWIIIEGVGDESILDCTDPANRRASPSMRKVVLRNLKMRGTIVGPSSSSNNSSTSSLAMENVTGEGYIENGAPISITGLWNNSYNVDCRFSNYKDGPGGARLNLRVILDGIYSDSFQGARVVKDCVVRNVERAPFLAFHPDVVQWHEKDTDNRILYNLTAVENLNCLGVGSGEVLTNIAIVNVRVTNAGVALSFSIANKADHIYVRNSEFNGGNQLIRRTAVITNMVVEKSLFRSRPSPQWEGTPQPGLVVR